LFFDQRLDHNPRVMMCRYEELVQRPSDMMQQLYAFIGLPYPGDKIIKDVHPQSIGKGRQSRLSASVEALCETMLERLDAAAHAKSHSTTIYSNGVLPHTAERIQETSANGNHH
jgi:hypothetical protein